MTNDKDYMRDYMKSYRSRNKKVPKTIEKKCINCGGVYNILEKGSGRSKYCLECKLLAISGKLKKRIYEKNT
jgi:hypothetical protein